LISHEQSFGYWLRLKRKALDLTREGLAARVGCSAATIRKIEAEERRPSRQIIEILATIFNIPPSEQAAFLRFGRGESGLAPTAGPEDSPWRPSRVLAHSNIPTLPTATIGRLADIATICGNLIDQDIRLITLLGPPGIGKTRLSQEVGLASRSAFADGIFFVAMAPISEPSLIAASIIQALGFQEVKDRSPVERLKDGIRDRRILLILDNLEHLIEDAAPLVANLLLDCPQISILTTSREALRVPGERVYLVPALQLPFESELLSIDVVTATQFAALALFTQRAQAVQPGFVLDSANLQAVAAICQQLDGLPLAIELLAARIRSMTPDMILSQMDKHLALYADGIRGLPVRQRTLHNAISWSYDLLSAPEKQIFACLSVFKGGFSPHTAEGAFRLAFTEQSVTDLITSLMDKSLLQRTHDAGNEPRFSMLVTIQHFAAERLHEMGLETTARDQHLAYFVELAEKADLETHGPDQAAWFDRVEIEYDNWRTALTWCMSQANTQAALRLLNALAWTWRLRAHSREMRFWYEKILAMPDVTSQPLLYARLLNQMGIQSFDLANYHDAQSLLAESQSIWLQSGAAGRRGLGETWIYLGLIVLITERDIPRVEACIEKAIALFQPCRDQQGLADSFFVLSLCANHVNQDARALALCEQSHELYQQAGNWWGIAMSSQYLGQLYLKQGDYEKALSFFERDLGIVQQLKYKGGIMIALRNLGDLYRFQGDFDHAEQLYKQSIITCKEIGMKKDLISLLYLLAMVALHRNDYSLARQRFIDYFDLAHNVFEKTSAGDLFSGMAAVAAGTHQFEVCAKLSGAAQRILDQEDYQLAHEKNEFNRHIFIARQQMGETAFETFAAQGYALPTEDAIAFALVG
jgi:predicted ATPase/DNA-binding XRE family transcriptional regulator